VTALQASSVPSIHKQLLFFLEVKKDRRGGNPRITGSLLNFLGSEELTGQGNQGFRNVSNREITRGLSLQKYAN